MWRALGFSLVLFLSATSFAASSGSGVLVDLGFLRYHQEVEGPQIGSSQSTNSFYDWKLGYLPGNDFYFGGMYSQHITDDGRGNETKRTLYGATVGFHRNGWFLDGTYFLDGQQESGSITYKKASGFGLDLGYHHMVNSVFFLGIEGSYKSFTFKEFSFGGATTTEDNKVKSEYYPMLILGLLF
ncbi:MAG: hypothetical protein ACAH59_11905 [Pseudobdellovibrionaceae bacterium]